MQATVNPSATTGISTDAKFWGYLAPFLLVSVGVWSYLIGWLLHEAPVVIPRFVRLLTAWA